MPVESGPTADFSALICMAIIPSGLVRGVTCRMMPTLVSTVPLLTPVVVSVDDVMREASCLGEGDVDYYQQLERRERLTHARGVRYRVGRVAALDQHRAKPLGMIGEDLIRNHVARRETSDQT